MVVPLAAIVMVIAIIWFNRRVQHARVQAQKEVRLAFLQKFSSGDEIVRFMATEEGKKFIDGLQPVRRPVDPRKTAVDEVTGAAVLIFIGAGFSLLRGIFMIPGIICLATGLGLGIAALLTWRISKKMDTQQSKL
ncbi:MAG: hypothetical protein GXX84_13645, partial [Acidobacteria bacterium]|nr:hypothetical protein [Acidobacteriota bacterium]